VLAASPDDVAVAPPISATVDKRTAQQRRPRTLNTHALFT